MKEKLLKEINNYLGQLFPITRSITGEGNRKTLEFLQQIIPLKILEFQSGKKCYDWIIPREWNIRDAWIKNAKGEKVIDFQNSNLHVVSYSMPISKKVTLAALQKHLFYLQDLPDAIPYRTSYYNPFWGFCLSYKDYIKYFNDETYEVFINSELKDGSLTAGELLIKGSSKKEFLISTYICHPSLANDNLSGLVLTAFLAQELLKRKTKHSYRFIFVPETIGAIAYCAAHEEAMKRISGGFVIACVGGPGRFSMKETYVGNHLIDKVIHKTLKEKNVQYEVYPFEPLGSDERQYSSPGFRIPCASIFRDKYGEYPQYHTSLDNLDFISPKNLLATLALHLEVIDNLEQCTFYISLNQHGEAQLGRRGLYPKIGGPNHFNKTNEQKIMSWILFLGDGNNSFFDVSETIGVPLEDVLDIAAKLEKSGLIKTIP